MKVSKLAILVAVAALETLVAQAASAATANPLWGCKINARVKDNSVSIILGVVNIQGNGVVICRTASGQTVSRNIVLSVGGLSLGPQLSGPTGGDGYMKVVSANIGVSSVEALFGQYTGEVGAQAQIFDAKLTTDWQVLNFKPTGEYGGISSGVKLGIEKGSSFGLGGSLKVTSMRIETPVQFRTRQEAEAAMYRPSEDDMRVNAFNSANTYGPAHTAPARAGRVSR